MTRLVGATDDERSLVLEALEEHADRLRDADPDRARVFDRLAFHVGAEVKEDGDVPPFFCPRCEETKQSGCPSNGRTLCHDCLDVNHRGEPRGAFESGRRTDLLAVAERTGHISRGYPTVTLAAIVSRLEGRDEAEVLEH